MLYHTYQLAHKSRLVTRWQQFCFGQHRHMDKPFVANSFNDKLADNY